MGRAVEEISYRFMKTTTRLTHPMTTYTVFLRVLMLASAFALFATPSVVRAELLCPSTHPLKDGVQVPFVGKTKACTNGTEILMPYDSTSAQPCADGKTLTPYRSGTSVLARCLAPGETIKKGQGTFPDQKPAAAVSCTGSWWNYIHPVCIMRYGFSWVGAMFVYVGIKIVIIAGGLFEAALKYTIVEFGKYLQLLKPGIDVGWTALRDIANIIIIGLFVFIAVNIILGVKDFGDKKRVARVLIVAVLINFSLLFTKVIVDASNFTAYQFYSQMIEGVEKQTATIAGYEVGSSVIAGKFMQFLGLAGISDSQDKLLKIGEDNRNAFYALGYGLLSLIFLLATAAVFLYGTFLIVSRAVLIVILMLTSAVAFASWLIPQQYVQSGFSKWWESLLKAAFLAPIMIALLWITVAVSEQIVKSGLAKGGTLGKLAENASNEANVTALLSMALILGLLFAAFAAADAFSKTISGFRFAQGGVLTALGVASRVGGIAGRFTLGAAAGGAFKGLRNAGASDYWAGRMAMRPLRWLGQKTYDPMSVGTVRRTTERLGGFVLGGDKFGDKGYLGGRARQARNAEELARAMRPPESVRNEMADQAAQGMRDMVSRERGAIDQEIGHHEGAIQGIPAVRQQAEQQETGRQQAQNANMTRAQMEDLVRNATGDRTTHEQRRDARQAHYQQEMAIEDQRIANAAFGSQDETEARARRAQLEQDLGREMQQFGADITTLRQAEEQHTQNLDHLTRSIRDAGDAAVQAIAEPAEAELEHLRQAREMNRTTSADRQQRTSDNVERRYSVRTIADAIVGGKLTPFRRGIRDELAGAIEQHSIDTAVAAFARAQRAPQAPAPVPAPVVPPAIP